jgi:hypothetical protein
MQLNQTMKKYTFKGQHLLQRDQHEKAVELLKYITIY